MGNNGVWATWDGKANLVGLSQGLSEEVICQLKSEG